MFRVCVHDDVWSRSSSHQRLMPPSCEARADLQTLVCSLRATWKALCPAIEKTFGFAAALLAWRPRTDVGAQSKRGDEDALCSAQQLASEFNSSRTGATSPLFGPPLHTLHPAAQENVPTMWHILKWSSKVGPQTLPSVSCLMSGKNGAEFILFKNK